jgi:hypothetical protein
MFLVLSALSVPLVQDAVARGEPVAFGTDRWTLADGRVVAYRLK